MVRKLLHYTPVRLLNGIKGPYLLESTEFIQNNITILQIISSIEILKPKLAATCTPWLTLSYRLSGNGRLHRLWHCLFRGRSTSRAWSTFVPVFRDLMGAIKVSVLCLQFLGEWPQPLHTAGNTQAGPFQGTRKVLALPSSGSTRLSCWHAYGAKGKKRTKQSGERLPALCNFILSLAPSPKSL